MDARLLITLATLSTLSLAGCINADATQDTGPTGIVRFSIVDDALAPTTLALQGAYALRSGDSPQWRTAVSNATWELDGSGDAAVVEGELPAGGYAQFRILFSESRQDGEAVILETDGIDIPVEFRVVPAAETDIEIGFSWPDAVYDAADGLAFTPALKSLRVEEAGEETLALAGQEIATGSGKAPVARIRAFDSTGTQVFESDFVAGSQVDPVIAANGNVTFIASLSEAVRPGATLQSYRWEFDDGTVLEGGTVEKPMAQSRNWTVRLTVADSHGQEDSQSIVVAVKPGIHELREPLEGTCSGVLSTPGDCIHNFQIDPTNVTIGENVRPAQLLLVKANIGLSGLNAPEQDLDLDVRDGVDARIKYSGNGGSDESIEQTYSSSSTLPAPGNWAVEVQPYAATAATYAGQFLVRWQILPEDPAYAAWIASYTDGHNHQH